MVCPFLCKGPSPAKEGYHWGDDHSSRPNVAIGLKRLTRPVIREPYLRASSNLKRAITVLLYREDGIYLVLLQVGFA